MRNFIKIGFIISSLLLLMSCSRGNDKVDVECDALIDGLINSNIEQVRIEMDKLTLDLFPQPTADDEIGHSDNFSQLVQRLNSECSSIQAKLLCYACVKTLPLQSEISILLDSGGIEVEKTLDISTPENEVLEFIGIH